MDGRMSGAAVAATALVFSGYVSLGVGAAGIAPGRDDFVDSNSSRCLSVPDAGPGDIAVINITNTDAIGNGYGALRASDAQAVYDRAASDQYASVNFAPLTPPNPNLALTTIGTNGEFCYDGATSDHNVILDVAAVIPAATVDAIDPKRLIDTRSSSIVRADSSVCVDGRDGAPGDVAVVNITNTDAVGSGYGALRSSDAAPVFARSASNQYASVNFAAATPPNPNLAFVEIGPDGRFCYDGAVSDHNVILDIAAIIPAANIDAIDPTRLLDTRSAGRPLAADTSTCTGVDGAAAGDVVVVNIANTGAIGTGYGALRASDSTPVYAQPVSDRYASVNFAPATPPNPNLAFVRIGSNGEFCYDGAVRHPRSVNVKQRSGFS